MNIKHGDIITLENGDEVKVSLEVLNKKVKELIVGKKYVLKWSMLHCHIYNITKAKYISNDDNIIDHIFIYVGKIKINNGERYIFYEDASDGPAYAMYGTNSLDFVLKQID